ncbi:hypothetical protein G6O69_14065 [Pseudenhygromyxa sp. WMMC2535]|uniref:hypothetical protein n=1 Tax=Pseudenhygromyxa sp. WMMC2535 TaxID=2712867 RepID=UPI0015570C8F|nr:hypothetical protein [Pseudenhygromyxa sp. WMMC2535]NVB38963.1 hypothetical protein [Pseudenhygromyxa sp. WMMC2535]
MFECVTPPNLRSLLKLIAAELEKLGRDYQKVARSARKRSQRTLARTLSRREGDSLRALRCFVERAEGMPALDSFVRLDWGFPFIDTTHVSNGASIEELLDAAEESDAALEQLYGELRRNMANPAQGFEGVRETFESLLETRQRELGETMKRRPMGRGIGIAV